MDAKITVCLDMMQALENMFWSEHGEKWVSEKDSRHAIFNGIHPVYDSLTLCAQSVHSRLRG
jgi:hypothetical protein